MEGTVVDVDEDLLLTEVAAEALPSIGVRLAAINERLAREQATPEQADLVRRVLVAFERLLEAVDLLGATIRNPWGLS